ncbi:hypothetical protein BGZ60DRAFT_479694 [Tricladium varicosporioides]|nr:hypothetical protein BGZ60DRAFT_479694 [Hymenoscyphus varicosporioides]
MDIPQELPQLFSSNAPKLHPVRSHTRNASRSPTRERIVTDDILADLSPATTLEAFTNPSGRLKASVEAATPAERAFGIRATLASKKIQEWVDELSNWSWPEEGGSVGFETREAKRRKLSGDGFEGRGSPNALKRHGTRDIDEPEYIGSLLADDVDRYEVRVEEITEDMEDLNVEEIKRQVLDTHFSPKSRPSSSASNAPMPSLFASYTKMDDFTAIVTATVLHALPNLNKLMRLMDVWNIRLLVLRKVPPLLAALDDLDIALRSGWTAIENGVDDIGILGDKIPEFLSRQSYEIIRSVLQDKVTTLGQDLDYMLDTLEGREDTLPDDWLDRMEALEHDYGEWVVSGDRKVRQGEWERMARSSISSDTPTITPTREEKSLPTAGLTPVTSEFETFEDEPSPSAGRMRARSELSRDLSPSPQELIIPSKSSSLESPVSPTFSITELSDVSTSSFEAHVLESIEVSETMPITSPKKSSDDHLQQQISSLLESIPARIHLTSEPDSKQVNTLKPKKTRRSVTPSLRPSSTMSNYTRAQTPSFLLSPAYSKTAIRQRPQSANPEIKLYHLSRSTGEAPIKLFVRLVGENGERVMVRVGGGWADLGEYLKEYASHHGRRSTAENDKIEIQDLPQRNVSSSSTTSTTPRGNGRSTPAQPFRPQSALDRPMSSLNVRKTRKSMGENEGRRIPSTPIPPINRHSLGETPTSSLSTASRSSSRLSWAEDDLSLGLAGPKSKKVVISEKDQEWVESMKEKVRQASAEKDREREKERRMKEKERERGASLGEMDKVGGTKRLFRKG